MYEEEQDPAEEPESKSWNKAAIAIWATWLAVFALVEWVGLRVNGDGWMPLTQWTRRYVPWWVVMPGLTWLWLHGLITYLRPAP